MEAKAVGMLDIRILDTETKCEKNHALYRQIILGVAPWAAIS